jgi:predicted ATP-dependent endonuclease of OLD family
MYISKLKIKNFKCFDEVEINFDRNFNLIIGENNSGKSTIFEALRLWQLAVYQFFKKRTGKTGDGSDNIGFYIKTSFEPLEVNDLSFLRIDNLNNILYKKKTFNEEDNQINNYENTFLIELIFSNDLEHTVSLPIVFRPREKTNILMCSISFTDDLDKKEQLKTISHNLSKVIKLNNNATFINRVRLAYIAPKFTLPNKETLFATDAAIVTKKLLFGESHLVIRNILHRWCEFSYQKQTKAKSGETIVKAIEKLKKLNFDEKIFEDNFELIKPFIQSKLAYDLIPQSNNKSQFLKNIEENLKTIVTQKFNFESINNPIEETYLKINDKNKNTEISQLGSGTINILNILSVLNYNDETINKRDATRCNILLLDEPDSHLQFNLQKNLFNFLENISSKDKKNRINKQIFIITHNSSLISQSKRILFIKNDDKSISSISFNEYLENHLKNIDENHYNVMKELHKAKKEKEDIEKQLSEYSKPVIYCEGTTDVKILKKAYEKLYKEEFFFNEKFNISNINGASGVASVLRNNQSKSNLCLVGILDNDSAGQKEIEKLRNNHSFTSTDNIHYKNQSNNSHILLLPIPESRLKSAKFFEKNTIIEYLFEDETLENKMQIKMITDKGETFKKINDDTKEQDKDSIVKNIGILEINDFKNFIPLFEKIAEIIGYQLPAINFDN